MTGDFNIHVDVPTASETKQFADLLAAHGLEQHIDIPTHQRGHILDLFITRSADPPVFSHLKVISGFSDHSAITCYLTVRKPRAQTKIKTTRNLHSIDLNLLCTEINDNHLTAQCSVINVNEAVDSYNSILSKLLDKFAPVKSRRVLMIWPDTGWYSHEVSQAKPKS